MDRNWGNADRVALAALVVIVAVTAYGLAMLPSIVAIHFTAGGNANGYGSKFTLLVVPAVAVFAYAAFAFRFKRNVLPNLPFSVPPERMEAVLEMNAIVLRWIRAEVLIVMAIVQWLLIGSARMGSLVPGFVEVIAVIIAVILGTIVLFLFRMFHAARG